MFVLLAHLCGTRGFPISAEVGHLLPLGELGVRVFFVISGFLITNLLLDELNRTGSIHLGRFYLRRTFRIFPPYYVLIAVLALASAAGLLQLAKGDLVHGLTYTSNYHATRSWWIGHTWSLAVEEQFYLLWPAVLLLAGLRRGVITAAAVVLIAPLVRIALWLFVPSVSDGIGHRFETVADALAIGCVLAVAAQRLVASPLYRRVLDSRAFILVPFAVIAASALHDRPRIYFLISFTIMNVGAALCVHWAVCHHAGRVGRILNARPLAFVGVISYSIYLWQQLFLNRYSGSFVASFPANLVLVFVAALASFYLIERPSLRARRSVEQWVFPRRKRVNVTNRSVALPITAMSTSSNAPGQTSH